MMSLRVVYAGRPGTAHTEGYRRLLADAFGEPRVIDIGELTTADLSVAEVLVVDPGPGRLGNIEEHLLLEGLSLETFTVPTVLVGTAGGQIGDRLRLKLTKSAGCACLGEHVHVPSPVHPVFQGPFAVDLNRSQYARPSEQFLRYAPFTPVPAGISALRVIRTPQQHPGLASSGHSFLEGPDTEFIAGGDNRRSHTYPAIGRHGKFVLWGFTAPAKDLTPEGEALLRNVIVHTAGLAGEQVNVLRYAKPRTVLISDGLGLLKDLHEEPADDRLGPESLRDAWGPTPPAGSDGDLEQRRAFWRQNRGYLAYSGDFSKGHFFVDEDARAWGVANDDISMLHRCLDALTTGEDSERATRLWTRYTGRPVEDPAVERRWLADNEEALYFSDWAGYQWQSTREPRPRGYRRGPRRQDRVLADLDAIGTAPGRVRITVDVLVEASWYVYAPGATEGIPILLYTDEERGHVLQNVRCPEGADGLLSGRFRIDAEMITPDSALSVRLRVQTCNKVMCEAPRDLWLATTVTGRNGLGRVREAITRA